MQGLHSIGNHFVVLGRPHIRTSVVRDLIVDAEQVNVAVGEGQGLVLVTCTNQSRHLIAISTVIALVAGIRHIQANIGFD